MHKILPPTAAIVLAVTAAGGAAHAQEGDDKNWDVSASAGFQYDDNVTVDETDTTTGQADEAGVFEFSGVYRPEFGRGVGLELGYDFFQSLYHEQDQFNLRSHSVSAYGERPLGEFDASLNYIYARTLLGGDDFLSLHSVTPGIGRLLTERWYANARYAYYNKDFIRGIDDGRDADTHSAALDNFLFFMSGAGYVSLGYRFEAEDARARRFDYLGHVFHVRLDAPIPVDALERWNPRARVGFEYGRKDFSGVTPSIGEERDDDRFTATLELSAELSEHAVASVEYKYIDASSNLASADYTENVATVRLGLRY